ncbi:MAG: DUF4244 domain-containing protein [Bifidobacteriaceae bacterium]|jgi:hypothetical protein|nr:DUF4244 domain-containing protein [Bifidobacteriaceae bacterium]
MKTELRKSVSRSADGPSAKRNLTRAELKPLLNEPEAGGITAEYAIAILTAAGFAGLLLAILQSDTVRAWLLAIVERALG